jgi:hypothetical protein
MAKRTAAKLTRLIGEWSRAACIMARGGEVNRGERRMRLAKTPKGFNCGRLGTDEDGD